MGRTKLVSLLMDSIGTEKLIIYKFWNYQQKLNVNEPPPRLNLAPRASIYNNSHLFINAAYR